MKRIFSVLFAFSLAFIFATPAEAKVIYEQNGNASIPATEVVNDDLWIAGQNVDIQGTVNGDVYAAGGAVSVSGRISGDLFVGAGTVTVTNATIGQDLYVGGGNVTITGTSIKDTLALGAGNVTVDDKSKIGGTFMAGAGSLTASAPVGKDAMLGAGNLSFDAPVQGEARIGGEAVTLGDKTKIGGDLYYAKSDTGTFVNDASISGATHATTFEGGKNVNQRELNQNLRKFGTAAAATGTILSFFSALLVGLFALWIGKPHFLLLEGRLAASPLRALGLGLLIFIFTIPALLVLMITVVGIPLALILFVTFFVSLYLSKLVVSLWLGKVVSARFGWKKLGEIETFLLGLILYYVVTAIPVLGWLLGLFALWLGLGSLVPRAKIKA